MAVLLNSYATKAYSEHPIALWPLDDDAYYLSLISKVNRRSENWDIKNCTMVDSSPQEGIPSSPFEGDDDWKEIELDNKNTISKNISNITANGESIIIKTNGAHKIFPGQLITITGVNPSSHNVSNAKVLSVPSNDELVIQSSVVDPYVSGGTVTCSTKTISLQSQPIFQLNQLNEELASFCINLYMYQKCSRVNYYEIGYVYFDTELSADKYVLERYDVDEQQIWLNFNSTFSIPQYDSQSVKIVIRINVNAGFISEDYIFYMNALSIGQWSETVSSISLGSIKTNVGPLNLLKPSLQYVQSNQYGVLSDDSYYIVENNKLLSQNQSLPIIFGTNSCTKIESSLYGNPSFIFPGKGMLFEEGRYRKFSLEMWIKIKPSTDESRKIIGPVSNDYGIYVREGFISLVIGNEIASHSISEWYRPMLLHILINDNEISMIINGENVATVSYDKENISLPGKEILDVNYWGIYSYSDIEMFQVDCISIYPYIVPTEIAKKRFVWGQGTESLQFIDNRFEGRTAAIDFSNAKYTANQIYPDISRWDAGYFNNMVATKDFLTIPNYQLPEIFLNERTEDDWYKDNKSINQLIYLSSVTAVSSSTPSAGKVTYTTSANHNFKIGNVVDISGVKSQYEVIKKYLQNNIATLTTSQIHNFKVGDTVTVAGVDATFNGTYIVTAKTAKTFSYSKTSTSVPLTNVSPSGTVSSPTALNGFNGEFVISNITSNTFTVENTNIATFVGLPGKASVFESANKFITFRPNIVNGQWSRTQAANPTILDTSWDEPAYLLFPSLNFLTNGLTAIYGIFEVLDNISSNRTLMRFINTSNNRSFDIIVNQTKVSYLLDNVVLYSEEITLNSPFAVGLNFELASIEFGYNILSFFASPSVIQAFIGGNRENTFEGKIYNISFSDQENYNNISNHFQNNGIVNSSDQQLLTSHFATYSLTPIFRYNRFFLDIDISAKWEEYFPLSYFASYVKNKNGQYYYDLDYMQLNIGYPAMFDYVTKIVDNLNWTYAELFEAYNTPIFKDYEILDNEIISHYYTYADMKENQETITTISTLSSSIQTYITFQLLSEGANEPLDSFIYTKNLSDNLTIDAEAENSNINPYKAYYTKFEFKDGVIVYPPKTINFEDVAIVVHFVINQKGILSAPLKIKDLEITSKALDDNTFNEIGTKFGTALIPYVKNGIYYSSKEKNPLLIYKGNTPYMYTTENSGIKILNTSDPSKEYGISMPINENSSDNFTIAAMQVWMMYDLLSFPQSNLPLFEIHYLYGVLEFIISPDVTGKRGLISARDKTTKAEFTELTYFQNGNITSNPIIRINDWNCIGISFSEELDFSNYPGSINMFGGILFNNLSYYRPGGLGKIQNSVFRKWSKVLNDGTQNLNWNYWLTTNQATNQNKWRNVYVAKEEVSYVNSPKQVYLSQVGVNSDIVDDNYGFTINANVIRSYTDIVWSSYDIVPI